MNAWQKIQQAIAKVAPWGKDVEGFEDMNRNAVRYGQTRDPKYKADADAMKALQEKNKIAIDTECTKTEKEIDALLPKVGAQALAVIGDHPKISAPSFGKSKNRTHDLQVLMVYRNKLEAAIAAGPSEKVPVAKVPAPAPTPAASAPAPAPVPATPQASAETLGKTVMGLATHPSASVREPIVAGINESMKAVAALTMTRAEFNSMTPQDRGLFMKSGGRLVDTKAEAGYTASQLGFGASETPKPTLLKEKVQGTIDFSFLPLDVKPRLVNEYNLEGGLSDTNWFTWYQHRSEYFQRVGNVPEAMRGEVATIPNFVLETTAEAAQRLRMWANAEKHMQAEIDRQQADIDQAKSASNSQNNAHSRIEFLTRGLESLKERLAKYKARCQEDFKNMLREREQAFLTKRATLY